MKLRWGFVGAGRIVHRFMAGLLQHADAIPHAVFARKKDRAEAIAQRYGMPLVFDDFDAFLQCKEIDVVYIAVTHPYHREYANKCLEAKIPVLCEKPMAPNAAQEQDMIDCARKNDTFLMEAMWTRAFPVTKQVLQWIDEGRIGKLVGLNGLFSIKAPDDANDRLYMPSEAGGSLLDIGVYLVAYAHMIMGGAPVEMVSLANFAGRPVDTDAGVVMRFDDDKIATLFMSLRSEGRDAITIYGTDGMIEVFEDFWRPRHARLTYSGGIINFDCPPVDEDAVYGSSVSFKGEGYQYEVAHVHECLEKGLKESPLITLEESLKIIQTCDALRALWGEKYPFEE
ncbi:MAG: Gfo/Idh/MocA family protein [Christensenellales bacterium]